MATLDVCVVGEINLDLILYGLPKKLVLDRELLASGLALTLGSSSAIFAHNLSMLGNKVGFISKTGGDALGKMALERLSVAGVDVGRVSQATGRTATASVPNAYYDPQLNSITFPAAILQPPLFDREADDAANFAAIGAIIGHELTHGFDDQGRKFDGDGNLHDWWTADDSKEYELRSQCIADEYSGFDATEGVKLNGKLTLGENTADNGGLRIALMALESTLSQQPSHTNSNGLTPQQEFFISYAEAWCSNATPQYLSMVAQSNPHATAKARANGVVSNMPEFQKAFGCKKGQPMVRENACRVW
jgi:putative endopeptidase